MGVNDAQEMLEAAQAECIRLERELADLASGSDHLAAKYWAQRQVARNKLREAQEMLDAQIVRGNELAEQLAAAFAVVEQLRNTGAVPIDEVWQRWRAIFAQTPTSALAKVKADVLREAADRISDSSMTRPRPAAAEWLRAEADRIESEAERG